MGPVIQAHHCEQLVATGLIWGTYNPTNLNISIHTVTHRLESPIA